MMKTIRDLFNEDEWKILSSSAVPELLEIEHLPLQADQGGKEATSDDQ